MPMPKKIERVFNKKCGRLLILSPIEEEHNKVIDDMDTYLTEIKEERDELKSACEEMMSVIQKAKDNQGFDNTKGIWLDFTKAERKIEQALKKGGA